jgi:hypothetical protein
MHKPRPIVLPMVLTVAFAASSAAADGPASAPDRASFTVTDAPARITRNGGSTAETPNADEAYRVVFDDDPLQAGGLGPIGARIAIMTRAARATLIRPRTAFVVELVKTVEQL